MKQKTISIIGLGWLGKALAQQLLNKGYKILGTTRSEEKQIRLEAAGIQTSLLDLADPETKDAQLWQSDIFFINIPPGRGKPNAVAAYPEGISWLLEQIVATEPKQKPWVIFASSTGVYGNTDALLTEASPCSPERASAKAIYAAEQGLQAYLAEVDLTVLRFAGLVGGSRQAGRFLAGKKELQIGDKPVNLVHRDDCIAIIEQLISLKKTGEIFNICADKHPIHRDFYPAQAKKLGLEPPTYTNDSIDQSRIVSNQKIKEELDYEFIWPDPMEFPIP
jgi:nucleoside-diphosphate-sugar epimerase